jgi:uncharacterized protein (TIGR02594 family)
VTDSISTIAVQRALKGLGFDPGPLDGVPGRKTQLAIKAFQTSRGLEPDGLIGPRTIAALIGQGAAEIPPNMGAKYLPWLEEARRLIGTRETPGPANNPVIMDWAAEIEVAYASDSNVPWCSLFASHCIAATLPNEPLTKSPLWARSWLSWGAKLPKAALGCVVVLERGANSGHVFFAEAVTADGKYLKGVGGNQSDRVGEAWFETARVLGYRWPKTVMVPDLRIPVEARGGAPTSQREA